MDPNMSCLDEREVWNLAPYVARDLSCHVMSRRARGVELSAVCGSGFIMSCHVMSRRARGVELGAVCGSGFIMSCHV